MHLRGQFTIRVTMLALVLAAIVLAGVAQQPEHKDKKEAPVLRAVSRLVLISAIVQDKNGVPVTGLTREDFEILDDGRAQDIAMFSMNASGESAPPEITPLYAAPPSLPESGTFSNREDRRVGAPTVTVILFDTLNTAARDTLYGQQQVVRFLQTLRPHDRVALYVLSGRGVHVLLDFTSDPAPLLRALERYRATEAERAGASDPEKSQTGIKVLDDFLRNTSQLESGFLLRDRVRRTVNAFVAIANHVMRIPGRKNMVWVSGSFPIANGFDRLYESTRGTGLAAQSAGSTSEATGLAQGPQSNPASSRTSGGALRRPPPPFATKDPDLLVSPDQDFFAGDLERAARALNQANLAIYPVDARGLMTAFPNPNFDPVAAAKGQGPAAPEFTKGGPSRKEFDSMNMLAERTGGRAFYNANEIYQSVRQAIDESRVTYELGYYPAHNSWDGKFHEITVRLKRPGLKVRNRRGYFAVPDAPTAASLHSEALQEAAESPLESAALGLRVRLERAAAGAVTVRIHMDLREISLKREGSRWTGAVALLIVQRKSNAPSVQSPAESVDLKLQQATYDKLLREGMKLSKTVRLEPDTEELRVIVRDGTTGATGSVFIPLNQVSL